MPFDFYFKLNRRQQRAYRKSDKVERLSLPGGALAEVWKWVDAMESALAEGQHKRVQEATTGLCLAVTEGFGVGPVVAKVKSRRPADRDGSEYYGMTTWEKGKLPLIEMWMLTRAKRRVVAFKTFMRTLLHELLHHLDVAHLGLDETFHTEGFFKRESSLYRQLVTDRPGRSDAADADATAKPSPPARPKRPAAVDEHGEVVAQEAAEGSSEQVAAGEDGPAVAEPPSKAEPKPKPQLDLPF